MASLSEDNQVIIKIAIPVPLNCLFDYLSLDSNTSVLPGTRVLVPFGHSKKVGFVIAQENSSHIQKRRLKKILQILDPKPLLCDKDLQLIHWASRYYHHPIGEVFSAAFPASLRKGKKAILPQENHYKLSSKGELLTPEQLKRTPKQQKIFKLFYSKNTSLSVTTLNQIEKNWRPAVNALIKKEILCLDLQTKVASQTNTKVEAPLLANDQQLAAITHLSKALGSFSVSLLEGITGSGKTEVYMQVIQQALNLGLQILILLPEITLTPQLQNRFKRRFSQPLSVSHSKLTETQRHTAWLEMQQGLSSILLGTRSALFTPLKNPGLIILDEEHDSSFKQQEGFRFSARDLAIVRGKILNIPVILGTATPSLESLYNAEKNRYHLLHLSERAGKAIKPTFQLLDIRNKKLQDGVSEPLLAQMKQKLAQNEQVLIFLNRRGYAPVQMCHQCAWIARCHQCDTNLVIHFDEKVLRCHHCNHQQPLLHQCPDCITGELKPLGLGTERVEKSLRTLFPNKKITRLDRDSTQRKGTLENHLDQINRGQVDIILGTQMLAKGHHFPNVTLVAILDVDSGLFSIDFHATEKLAQLIIQVAGRAGRAEKPGKVILQTHQPNHPLLTILLHEGYNSFAKTALEERKQALLPPFSSQTLLRAYATNPIDPQEFLNSVCSIISTMNTADTLVLGPVSAPMAKRANNYHFQLLLQNNSRKKLQLFLNQLVPQLYLIKKANTVRWSIDVDPIDLF